MEFPELKGHSRRDYWLAIMQEVLYVHRFIRKFQIEGVQKEETLSRAIMGIMRLQTLLELVPSEVIRYESLLTFNLCDQLPGGDRILEALASMMASKGSEHTIRSTSGAGSPSYSVSAMGILSNLGVMLPVSTCERLCIGKLIVGEMTPLEKAVTECATNFKKIEQAQAAVGMVKVDGLDTNLALMKVFYLVISLIYFPFFEFKLVKTFRVLTIEKAS